MEIQGLLRELPALPLPSLFFLDVNLHKKVTQKFKLAGEF